MVDTKLASRKHVPVDGVRVNRTGRRTFSAEYKRRLVGQCAEGVSVAGIALANGINANLLRRWIVHHRRGEAARTPLRLLPVSVEATPPAERRATARSARSSGCRTSGAIEIEVYGARIRLRGAIDAASLAIVLEALSRQ